MNEKALKLRQERKAKAEEARKILDAAGTKALSGDEEARYDAIMKEVDGLSKSITAEERLSAIEAESRQLMEVPAIRMAATDVMVAEAEQRAAFAKFLRSGKDSLTQVEARAMSAGTDAQGGYLITPQKIVEGILQAVDQALPFRSLCTTLKTDGFQSLGVVTLDSDVDDADWTTEALTGSDTTVGLGKRELKPNPLAKGTKISNDLLASTSFDVVGFVMGRLAYKFALAQEKAFMVGTGTNQALGIFVANANGIPTTRDLEVGAFSAFDGDDLIDLYYGISDGYRRNATFTMHTDIVKGLRKLKNATTGDYMWQPGIAAGEPDKILGRPISINDAAPNATTNGSYLAVFGDMKQYWVVDSMTIRFARLNELYAAANQTGFIGRAMCDGQPVQPLAFKRAKASA